MVTLLDDMESMSYDVVNDMLHVYNDVVQPCNDIVLDIGLEHQDPESMSYDVVNDMRAGRYSPDFMSYDVVNDISHVYFDIVLHWNDIDLDM